MLSHLSSQDKISSIWPKSCFLPKSFDVSLAPHLWYPATRALELQIISKESVTTFLPSTSLRHPPLFPRLHETLCYEPSSHHLGAYSCAPWKDHHNCICRWFHPQKWGREVYHILTQLCLNRMSPGGGVRVYTCGRRLKQRYPSKQLSKPFIPAG